MKRLAHALAVMLLFSAGPLRAASQQGRDVTRIGVRRTNAPGRRKLLIRTTAPRSNAKRDTSLKECLMAYNLRPAPA
jgi:hypothetical protein